MTVTDLLLIIVFLAVITYRVLKKKKDSKKEKQLDIIDINSHNKDTENNTIPVHRVYVQAIECNKMESADLVASNVTHAVIEYLESIDNMDALRPSDIGFFTNFNRIFIVYKW